MRKIFPMVGLGFLALAPVSAQNTFSDDFESYTAGDYIGVESPQFTTWSNAPGGTEDVLVVNNDAHSGSNSLFLSSTATNGGPQDLLLPFGSVINTGHFTLQAAFKIQAGKKGYFNLQKTTTPGTTWTMDVNFSGGQISFENGGTVLFTTAYPEATWFEWRLEINPNNSRWEVYIDDVYRGFFHNPEYQFASMNIFAMAQSAFWVDDVAYEYTPFTAPATNAALAYLNGISGGLVGQNKIPAAVVRNLGTTPITSFDITVDYNGDTYSQSFSSLNIAPNATQNVAVLPGFELAQGPLPLLAYISNVNGNNPDGDSGDDSVGFSLTPVVPAVGRIVIAEEGTGTWCGWCPRGAVTMERMEQQYSEHFQGIAVHNDDPMAVAMYDAGLGISSFPGAKVDRLPVIDPIDIEQDFLPQVQIPASGFITVGATWNATERELAVSLKYDFQTTITGNWKAALVITENEVTGTGSGWSQSNYYANNANGPMGGYENLPSHVPASQMVYNDVARLISPSFAGKPNAFASPSNAGDSHTYNFHVNVPTGWEVDKLHIIGLLIKPNGRIDNAGVATVAEAETNGFVEGENISNASVENIGAPDASFVLYPNPAHDYSLVKIELKEASDMTLSVRDLTGKELFARNYGTLSGAQILPIRTETLATGIYLVEVHMNGQRYSAKLVKE